MIKSVNFKLSQVSFIKNNLFFNCQLIVILLLRPSLKTSIYLSKLILFSLCCFCFLLLCQPLICSFFKIRNSKCMKISMLISCIYSQVTTRKKKCMFVYLFNAFVSIVNNFANGLVTWTSKRIQLIKANMFAQKKNKNKNSVSCYLLKLDIPLVLNYLSYFYLIGILKKVRKNFNCFTLIFILKYNLFSLSIFFIYVSSLYN